MVKYDPWKIATVALVIVLVASIATSGFSSFTSKETVSQDALTYINTNLLQGTQATLTEVSEDAGLYTLKLNIQGEAVDVYVSKDGKYVFPTAIDMNGEVTAPVQAAPTTTQSDKPHVELFVMSHCPYGTQMQKGILPVAYLLGDNIDFEYKFVNYAMHGEVEVKEQLNQYCIFEEQNGKFLDYLKCFLEAGDSQGCLASTSIDMAKLSSCTAKADAEFNIISNLEDQSTWLSGRFPIFNTHAEDNVKYGVRGSPTLVVNGQVVQPGRDSVSLLNAICGAFTNAPEECNTQLEAGTPSPGFGWTITGSSNVASCGG